MKRWIHHAYEHGDETFLQFTGGKSLFEDYVTYHDEYTDYFPEAGSTPEVATPPAQFTEDISHGSDP